MALRPNTVCAYAYALRPLAVFLDARALGWNDFRPSTALEFLAHLRRVPCQRPAQRLGLTVATEQGRPLSAATVQQVLAAPRVSSSGRSLLSSTPPARCDLVLTCSKLLTTSDYTPRLRQRLATEELLIADAVTCGWDHE